MLLWLSMVSVLQFPFHYACTDFTQSVPESSWLEREGVLVKSGWPHQSQGALSILGPSLPCPLLLVCWASVPASYFTWIAVRLFVAAPLLQPSSLSSSWISCLQINITPGGSRRAWQHWLPVWSWILLFVMLFLSTVTSLFTVMSGVW